jgi:hypothetical protein
MKVRAYFLAALALGASTAAVHAQRADDPHRASAASQSAESQSNSKLPVGTGRAPQSPGVETQSNVVGGVAGNVKDLPAGADSNKSAGDQSGPRSRTGIGTGTPETASGRQPGIKPIPSDSTKEGISGSPIDTSITVHQGRRPNKDPKSMSVNGRAFLGHLLNKSKSPTIPGVANHHDAHKPQQKLLGGGHDAPMRNAIGAHVEHRAMAHHDAASPIGKSTVQGIVPQGASTPSPGAQGPVSPTSGPVAATNQNRGMPPINHTEPPAHGPVTLPLGGPAINGTAMIRPGSSTGAIGGSTKTMAGVISGSNFRMRHP